MWDFPDFSQCQAVNKISTEFQNLANTPINKGKYLEYQIGYVSSR